MMQPYNRCYPSYGVQAAPFVMNQGAQQKVYQKSETRKAIDHYSYALNEEIGRGFSSKVYKGRDENTMQPVAVKVIDMKMVKQSIHSVLLKNEISALKSFNSKNILQLYDVFQTQNNTYLITEYCDSGDLSARIKRRGRIDEGESIRILKDVVAGLLEINQKGCIFILIHNIGFIHRDIKPANILIDGTTPKIADFGFAVSLNSNDARSQGKNFNVGTPLYMSPQALRQQGHTEKGDIWAIGVMFFEMIYGRAPFTAQSEAALLSNILHQGLTIPASPAVSELCKDFIRRCLQVDEGRRFRVKEMAQHALVQGEKLLRLPAHHEVVERMPLREMQVNNNQQKEKRSHSQGVKEYNSRPIKSENVLLKKNENVRPPPVANIFVDPHHQRAANRRTITDVTMLDNTKDLVGRSKSQKQMLDVKNITKIQHKVTAQDCPSPSYLRKQQSLDVEATKSNDVKLAPRFKNNNDILFSQINFCRFVYKFSQQLMSKPSSLVREKLLFVMAKNVYIKINKLSQLNEKENYKDNLFQLEDYDNYKKSDSFGKFSQAIWEYNEKYKKHFERLFALVAKNGLCADKKFEVLYDRDLNEFESFYLIAQTFLKQTIVDSTNLTITEETLAEHQYSLWVVDNLLDYWHLITQILDSQGDYRKFMKVARVEQYVDRKQRQYSLKEAHELMHKINQLTSNK